MQDESHTNSGTGARDDAEVAEPMEDSLSILWDVVSTLHDNGWQEDDLPKAIPRLSRKPTLELKLSSLSSLSLPEDFVTADTIPSNLTRMSAYEIASHPGVEGGTTRYLSVGTAGVPCA